MLNWNDKGTAFAHASLGDCGRVATIERKVSVVAWHISLGYGRHGECDTDDEAKAAAAAAVLDWIRASRVVQDAMRRIQVAFDPHVDQALCTFQEGTRNEIGRRIKSGLIEAFEVAMSDFHL